MPLPRPAPGTTRWWVVGTVGCLAAVAFIIWWGITTTVGSVRPEVTAYEVQSDSMVLVEYDLHRPQGVAVVCQVVGLDNNKGRVGAVEDSIPASGPASVHRVVSLRTSARAVTGVVDSCTRQPPPPDPDPPRPHRPPPRPSHSSDLLPLTHAQTPETAAFVWLISNMSGGW